MTASGRVVVVGSLNIDLVTRVERHPKPGETVRGWGLRRLAGGKGANQAVAARLEGAEVAMVGAVGGDEGGAAYRKRLERLGIDITGVRVVGGAPTGHALVCVDEFGENSIVVVPGANAELGSDAHILANLGVGDVVLLQLEIPGDTVAATIRRAVGRGARVVLNMAPFARLPPDVVALADPLVVNEHEARLLADTDLVPASLLVTFGAAGASWGGMQGLAQTVPEGDVVDTTGAGDAFCGALAAALARDADREEALEAALAAGAASVRHTGAQREPEL